MVKYICSVKKTQPASYCTIHLVKILEYLPTKIIHTVFLMWNANIL